MNKLFSFFLVGMLCLLPFIGVFGQTKVFEGIEDIELKNSGTIMKNKVVTGYYFFYKTDKIDRKTNAYEIKFLDANLNDIGSQKITGSKYLTLISSSYNGHAIYLKFGDYKSKRGLNYLFDEKGKIISKTSVALTRLQLAQLAASAKNGSNSGDLNLAVPDKGFASYIPGQSKSQGKIVFLPSKKGVKAWKFLVPSAGYKYTLSYPMGVHNGMIISLLMRKKNVTTRDLDYSILAISPTTGRKIFEQKFKRTKYTLEPMNTYALSDSTFAVFGQYYDLKAKTMKDQSLGLYSAVLDKKGKIVSEKYLSWAEDVSKHMEMNARGKVKSIGFLYFHNIVKAADGKIFAVAEGYKKTVSALGIAAGMLGDRSAGAVQMTIDDLVLFEFSPDFTLSNVHIYDKGKSRYQLPKGTLIAGGNKFVALQLKGRGAFDYSFTQENTEKKIFTVGYLDYDKPKKGKSKWVFGALTYADGKMIQDKMDLKTKNVDYLSVMRAKPGFILVTEYDRKKKSVSLRLEKINY